MTESQKAAPVDTGGQHGAGAGEDLAHGAVQQHAQAQRILLAHVQLASHPPWLRLILQIIALGPPLRLLTLGKTVRRNGLLPACAARLLSCRVGATFHCILGVVSAEMPHAEVTHVTRTRDVWARQCRQVYKVPVMALDMA